METERPRKMCLSLDFLLVKYGQRQERVIS